MTKQWKSRLQFRLRDVFVIFLGIAIGYSLNLTVRLLREGPSQAGITVFPTYVIEPPDILSIESNGAFTNRFPSISGKHLVGMDGRINLGAFGSVYVAGLTISEAQSAVQTVVAGQVALRNLTVDVHANNSKTFYVITQNNGVDSVVEAPITGNETVLDAIAQVRGVPKSGRLWISRPAPNGGKETILPVAWTTSARAHRHRPIIDCGREIDSTLTIPPRAQRQIEPSTQPPHRPSTSLRRTL